MKALLTVVMVMALCLAVAAQDPTPPVPPLTKEQRKAERERVKQEQKFLDQQAKQEKKQKLQEAAVLPTWTVIDAKPAELKGVLIQHVKSMGYSLESETDHTLNFWREMPGFEGFGPTLAMGNKYSDTPRKHIQFLITDDEHGGTRVDCEGFVTVRMLLGKENRRDITQNASFRADIQAEYDALRSWAEHQKQMAKQ